MDMGRFQAMVDRLERESAASPGAYRVKVALLALLVKPILTPASRSPRASRRLTSAATASSSARRCWRTSR